VQKREVAGVQPAVRGDRRGIGFRVAEVTGGDVLAADLQMTDLIRPDLAARVVDQP
jgi:hypothetical protein